MNEVPGPGTGTVVSAGALLREARERVGMHIGALAVGLKVPVKKIEALEADRLDLLPDAVFARALASSIARTLKTDPAPILAALPQSQAPGLDVGHSVSGIGAGTATLSVLGTVLTILKKPAVLIGGVLVVGALALVFVPAPETFPSDPASPLPSSITPGVVQSGLDAAATLSKVASNESLVAAQGLLSPSAASPRGTETGAGKTVSAQAVQSAASPAASPALPGNGRVTDAAMVLGSGVEVQAKPGNTGLILLNASGVTWVEVTDAEGIVQLRKTLAAGENASAGGVLPLKVVVGRVNATKVQVRGKPFDIAPFGKDNVARFEVR